MAARNKLTAQERHIWSLRMVVVGLFIALCISIWSTRTSIEDLTLHIPPDLSAGVKLKAGEIHKANIYTFAAYVMISINDWQKNGAGDFPRLINEYACAVTPRFKVELEASKEEKARNGELARTRSAGQLGVFTDAHVQILSKNQSWLVWLDLAINEHVNGVQVKDTSIRYPVPVVRDNRKCNPFGLAIDGYEQTPERIQ